MKAMAAGCATLLCLAGCASPQAPGAGREQASAKVHTELAAEYYARKQYAIALSELAVALKFEPDYAPAYNVRGLVRMALSEDREAEADFQRSLALDGANPEAHNNYGWFLCQRGQVRASVDQFMAALKNPLYATPEMAYLNAGICTRKSGDVKQANAYLQKALLLRPDMPGALLSLASLNFDNANCADADAYFGRYAQGAGDAMSAEDLLLGVRIARKQGNRSAERSYSLQLGKRFPESREFQLMQQER